MLTVDAVREALGLDPADTTDDAWLAACVDAVNAWVARLPVVVDSPDPTMWTADVLHGANLLAQHEYRTRGAPMGGVSLYEGGGSFGQAYASPEVSRFLQLHKYARPGIAGAR